MRPTVRGLLSWLVIAVSVLHARSAAAQAPQVFSASGADVPAAIAAFKAALGGADNGATPGSQATGYRQITWDDVPDQFADPNQLPPDYYNVNSPRGMVLQPGGYLPSFKVSAGPSNPTSTPTLFGHPELFTAYSAPRIFAAGGIDSSSSFVAFQIPGTQAQATVSGFGVVFTNVVKSEPYFASIEFLDVDDRSMGVFAAPVAAAQNVSFVGVVFPTARASKVWISAGSSPLGNADPSTKVAMDDFIYGEPQTPPPPTLTITTPTSAATLEATGPFLTVAGVASNVGTIDWTSDRGVSGQAYGTPWSAVDIPLAPGMNHITFTGTGRTDQTATVTKVLQVNSNVFAYHLAEGSTGNFFDTDISIANPNSTPAPITLDFLREDGGHVTQTDTIGPMSEKTIHVDAVPGVEATAFSTIVTSESRLPLIVERTMFWGQRYWGSKGAKAIDTPSETWLFAEGVENDFFNTFILLQNPNSSAATATLTFQRAFDEAPIVQNVPLPPLSRVTVDAFNIAPLVGRSFGLSVGADQPIIAERSTYFETTPTQLWGGGHGSPGVTTPAATWYFAEGATSAFHDTFLLLTNPNDFAININGTFFIDPPRVVDLNLGTIAPHGRLTVPVNGIAGLENAEFVARLYSAFPFVAERAMYWHGAPGPWADGTSTFGVTVPASRWGFAEGRAGGPFEFHTYLRIYNAQTAGNTAVDADVKVTFLLTDGSTIVKNYTVPFWNFYSNVAPSPFITIDVNAIPGLDGKSFGMLVESLNDQLIVTERSMYFSNDGVFWAGGITTAGTRLP